MYLSKHGRAILRDVYLTDERGCTTTGELGKMEMNPMKRALRCALPIVTAVILSLSGWHTAFAGDTKGMGGWGVGSPDNKMYKASELDAFKATIVSIKEVTPMPGMSSGVAIYVKESDDDDPIEVHVCPSWFMKSGAIGLKRRDRVKVRGVWAEIGGKDVFMASKIKKGDYFVLKVRLTKDGKPFWTMSPEELEQEKKADGSK